MRVLEYKKHESCWSEYRFGTTYPMEWRTIIFLCRAVYPILVNPEVLVAGNNDLNFERKEIKDVDSILELKEGIEIRGECQVYDGVPITIRFYNQTENAQLFVLTDYIDSIAEKENLDDDGKKHRFDRFMDSLEYVSAAEAGKYIKAKELMDSLPKAIMQKDNFAEDRIFTDKAVPGYGISLTAICKKVAENWQETR